MNMTTVDEPVTKRNTNIAQGIMQRALRDQRTQEIMYEVCWLKVTINLGSLGSGIMNNTQRMIHNVLFQYIIESIYTVYF